MNDTSHPLTYRFHLPCAENLRPLLEQPYVTAAILRDILRARGTFINSQDKNTLVGYFMLTYLTPKEFDYLMSIVIEREEKKKVRNDYDELDTESPIPFVDALPSPAALDLKNVTREKLRHCELQGNPSLVRVSENHHQIIFDLKRRNLHSSWLKSEQIFPAEVNVIRDTDRNVVKIESWHTSEETRQLTRSATRSIRRNMVNTGFVKPDSTKTIRFNSFSNAQRIEFLMKYTTDFSVGNYQFTFEKLEDLSLKLDEGTNCTDDRLKWMKNKVSKLNVSGTALEDTFFVTDLSCRDHLHVWRFACRYKYESIDGKGTAIVIFEFGGFGKRKNINAPFQISCDKLYTSKFTGSITALKRSLLSCLNDNQLVFQDSVQTPA